MNNRGVRPKPAMIPALDWSDYSFGSAYAGGAQFLMGDGSGRMISETINSVTYSRLGTRNDGLAVTVP